MAIFLFAVAVAFFTVRRAPMRSTKITTLAEGVTKKTSDISVKSATSFLDAFVSKYVSMLKKHVHPDFHDKFTLPPNKSVSAKAFFSTSGEAFLYLYPSIDPTIEAQWSKYPLQFSIFAGLGAVGSKTKLLVEESQLENSYKTLKPAFRLADNIHITISKLTLSSPSSKFFDFGKCSMVGFNDMSFQVNDRNTPIEFFGFLTGDSDFGCVLHFASELAESFVTLEMQELFKKSEFFRKSLAHERLRPEAEKIKAHIERAQKDQTFNYPVWQMEKEVKNLRDLAIQWEIDVSYVDKLLMSIKPMNGNLLGYYSDAPGFMGQWILANAFLLFSVSLLFFDILNYV